jgi:hypothetical protein
LGVWWRLKLAEASPSADSEQREVQYCRNRGLGYGEVCVEMGLGLGRELVRLCRWLFSE